MVSFRWPKSFEENFWTFKFGFSEKLNIQTNPLERVLSRRFWENFKENFQKLKWRVHIWKISWNLVNWKKIEWKFFRSILIFREFFSWRKIDLFSNCELKSRTVFKTNFRKFFEKLFFETKIFFLSFFFFLKSL